ncbi:hypothetical protein [Antarctobacter jejuensis]|uniref:hypothetical protein n=1 Tax=Antarctobacter jejuensis TaxID=1439938 RepID=UPI003FD21788
MSSSSKILTVSYGTFSCTAEGFDDPLDVVKETTHFFRGVVGEDRFFGAEPPQFDPELASEYLRDRLADSGKTGGTLSLGSPPRVMAAAASAGAMAAAFNAGPADVTDTDALLPDDDTIEATAVLTERTVLDDADPSLGDDLGETALDGTEAALAPLASAPDDIAAKLDRIRAVVAQAEEDEETAEPDVIDEPEMEAVEPVAEPVSEPDPVLIAESLTQEIEAVEPEPVAADPEPEMQEPLDLTPDMVLAPETDFAPVTDYAPEMDLAPETDLAPEMDWTPEVEPVPETGLATEPEALDLDAAEPGDVPDALESLLGELVVESGDADAADLTAEALEDDSDPETDDGALDAAVADLMVDEDDDDERDAVTPVAAATAAVAALVGGAAIASQDDAEHDDADEDFDRAEADFDDFDAAETALDQAWAAEAAPKPMFEEFEEDEIDQPEPEADLAEAEQDEPAAFTPMPEQVPGVAPVRARVVKVKRAAFEQAIDDGRLEEILDEPAPTPAPVSESSLTPEEEEELARELAAVKAELASDFGAWDEDEVEPETDSAEADGPEREALRFDDDELELKREDELVFDDEVELELDDDEDLDDAAILEAAVAAQVPEEVDAPEALAPLRLEHPVQTSDEDWNEDWAAEADDQLEDDLDDEWDDEEREAVHDSARKAVKMASPARALLTEQEVADDDTSRLLDQTNSELDEPEGNRRRSAIAHLRAAVAATKADRLLGRKSDAAEEQEPYREDLASVVRPRRPQSTGVRQARPESAPAPGSPLKLVADQLVRPVEAPQPKAETVAATPAAPVRPRRVRRANPPVEQTSAGPDGENSEFALYAQSVGASDLPELLEAAAAYMSYVEGRDQFSRPQLMTTLRQAEVTDSSREDRLRSFGQLLREGKIRKTSGGRFTAAETISFKPDRAANG